MPRTRPSLLTIKARQRAIDRIAHKGLVAARRISFNLRAHVLASYRRGKMPTGIAPYLMKSLTPELRDAMVATHLTARQQQGVLKMSSFDGILGKMKTADIKKLQAVYDTDALEILKGASQSIDEELREVVLELIHSGAHEAAGAKVLREAFDDLGLTDVKDFRLATIFRTQTQFAYGAGNWESYKDPDIDEILWGFEYSTAGDDRVRPVHDALEGVTLPKDHEFWQKFWPPNGWNCRCQPIPLYEPHEWVLPPEEASDGSPIVPDPGFGFNAGTAFAFSRTSRRKLIAIAFEFNPDQPRNPDGTWGSGVGGAATATRGSGGSKFKDREAGFKKAGLSKADTAKLAVINPKGIGKVINVPLKFSPDKVAAIQKANPQAQIKKINAVKFIKENPPFKVSAAPAPKASHEPPTNFKVQKEYFKVKYPGLKDAEHTLLASMNPKPGKEAIIPDFIANKINASKQGSSTPKQPEGPPKSSSFNGRAKDFKANIPGITTTNAAKMAALNHEGVPKGELHIPLSMKSQMLTIQAKYPGMKIVPKNASKVLKTNLMSGELKADKHKEDVLGSVKQKAEGEVKVDKNGFPGIKSSPTSPAKVDSSQFYAWKKSLTSGQESAVSSFTGGGFHNIREAERKGSSDPKMTKKVKDWNDALDKAPKYEGITYRGMHISSTSKFHDEHPVGSTMTMTCSSSSSRSPQVAKGFSGGQTVLRIKGYSGAAVEGLSNYKSEKEVVLRKGAKYKVVAIHENYEVHGAHKVYDLEEI